MKTFFFFFSKTIGGHLSMTKTFRMRISTENDDAPHTTRYHHRPLQAIYSRFVSLVAMEHTTRNQMDQ